MTVEHRLVVYGSLAPGESNHGQMAGMTGVWSPGVVRGRLADQGWGSGEGFPGLLPDPDGPEVTVQVFTSADLPANWARLDDFEGEDYRRVVINVATADGPIQAYVYAVGGASAQAAAAAPA